MEAPKDNAAFLTAMKRLSTALSTELTEDRVAVYWDALADLPIEWVTFACQYATRYWRPTTEERRFPMPITLREYGRHYREKQLQRAAATASHQLARWSETPDEAGVAAIRQVLQLLGEEMDLTTKHPVYQAPSLDDPEKRRAELLEQARQLLMNPNGKE